MMNRMGMLSSIAILSLASVAQADHGERCRTIDAKLVEVQGGAENCPADHPGCFIGQLDGRHAHATTQFFGTSGAPGPSGSPGWFVYSGETQYRFRRGTLLMHETGMGTTPASGVVPLTSAVEAITGGDGNLAGATGVLFVNGFNLDDGSVVTQVHGQYCVPRGHGDAMPDEADDDGDDAASED